MISCPQVLWFFGRNKSSVLSQKSNKKESNLVEIFLSKLDRCANAYFDIDFQQLIIKNLQVIQQESNYFK